MLDPVTKLRPILARKLSLAGELAGEDLDALTWAVKQVRRVPAHTVLIDEGDRPEYVHVVLEGFAFRYKVLPDGERQVLAWLVPGDFCDLHVAVLGEMDHAIATVSESTIGQIPTDQVEQLAQTSPALSRALWWASLVQEAILREWLVNLGRRTAEGRMAHFFCELHARLASVELVGDGALDFPLTQAELADSLGISAVHTNRTLQVLRDAGLVQWTGRKLVLANIDGLRKLAQFDPNYLHLQPRSRRGNPSNAAPGAFV